MKKILPFFILNISIYANADISFIKEFNVDLLNNTSHLSNEIYDTNKSIIKNDLISKNFEIADIPSTLKDSLVIAKKDHTILFVFRGTVTDEDKNVDANITLMNFSSNTTFNDVQVHSGFYGVTDNIINNVNNIKFGTTTLQTILDDNSSNYILTGHSLGGAIAELLSAKMEENYNINNENILLYTYGTPPVGNTQWKNIFDNNSSKFDLKYNYRIVNKFDGVSCSNFYTSLDYSQIGNYYLLDDQNNQMINNDDINFQKSYCPTLLQFLASSGENHYLSNYLTTIDDFSSKDFITIEKDWNLISIPSTNTILPTQLSSDVVWRWNNNNWEAYSSDTSFQTKLNDKNITLLSQFNSTDGFWSHAQYESLKFFDKKEYSFDSITLNDGWNLIGVSEDINCTNIENASIIWSYTNNTWSVYGKDLDEEIYTKYTKLNTLNPNSGYWIYK